MREQQEETGPLLQLGEALRTAHRDLDGEQLRELPARQRQVISALGRQARQLTAQAGQPISEDAQREVEETLRAVPADPQAAREWARGRLTRPLTVPTGFAAVAEAAGTAAPAEPPAPRRRGRGKGAVADLDAVRIRRRERSEQLKRARRQAGEARQALDAREGELAAARSGERRAEDRRQRAEERAAELARQLKEAEAEQRRTADGRCEAAGTSAAAAQPAWCCSGQPGGGARPLSGDRSHTPPTRRTFPGRTAVRPATPSADAAGNTCLDQYSCYQSVSLLTSAEAKGVTRPKVPSGEHRWCR